MLARTASNARRQRRQANAHQRLLRERDRLIAELEHKNAELERKNAELERINYTISHDLKTPLVTIKGFLGLLRRDVASGESERVASDIDRISEAADRMSMLLEQLLELARLDHRADRSQEVSLGALAVEAKQILVSRPAKRPVEIVIASDLPTVHGDRLRLYEVMQNLLENAVKYMGDQSSPRVEIGVRIAGSGQVITVRDNGIGIEPKYHRQIFQLFERLDADTEGSGVGLALVKRVIEMHGGRIWIESEGLGHGSTFCFTLGENHLAASAQPPAAENLKPAASC